MATFTVTSGLDSGTGTLRQAILDANSTVGVPDTIVFDTALIGGTTITLTSGQLTITDDLTIDGDLDDNNTADITVQRSSTAPAFRIFNINDSNNATFDNVTIDGLIIRGGSVTGNGGGIYNRENLTVRNSTIGGNSASSNGGGIFNREATASIISSTIVGNTARADGGGIFNRQATANISNSTIGGNSAGSDGGGIFNREATASIISSTIGGNTAGYQGGGIYNRQATASISNSTIGGNSANIGGGIYNFNNATASITGSTIGGNTAGYQGGGIFNREATASISNSTIGGNTAGDGGGIYNASATASISNSTISGNTATSRGGGLLVQSGSVSSISTTFFNNSGIGIDLQGGNEDSNFVTANDSGDGDSGANGLQNFPVLSFTGSTITGTLNSNPNTNFLIQLFSNTTADPSGFGEGQVLVGTQTVSTNTASIATFTFTGLSGSNFSALATNLTTNQISEFSAIVTPPADVIDR